MEKKNYHHMKYIKGCVCTYGLVVVVVVVVEVYEMLVWKFMPSKNICPGNRVVSENHEGR